MLPTLFRAKFISPIHQPIIRDGGLLVANGKILAVGPSDNFISQKHELVDLGDVIITPGLVNAHVHLELSHLTRVGERCDSFTNWLMQMPRATGDPGQYAADAARIGISESLAFGVTTIGDISQHAAATRGVLRESQLRAVSFGEAIGLAKRRLRFEELLNSATDASLANSRLRIGISPHSPYTVDVAGFISALRIAKENNLQLATHLAESFDETEFLESHSGPFRELWNTLGWWQDDVKTFNGSPIDMADAIGLLEFPSLLAHVNYASDVEMEKLSKGKSSVVYCPRTHAFFNHPPHRWKEMIARGINVALGTDSRASSPDLNLLAEMRLLRKIAPEVSAETIWEMGTIRGAKALRWDDEIGSLEAGKSADFLAFEAESLEDILSAELKPTGVWSSGRRVEANQ